MIARPLLATLIAMTGLSAGHAFAETRNASPLPIEIATGQTAGNVITTLAQDAITGLTDQTLGDDVRRQNFINLMDQYFEMNVISRFVLGRYWRDLSEEQLTEFGKLLEEYLARNYANQFKNFNGEQFVVGDESQQKADTFVNSQFVRPDGPPVNIVWRMREFDGAFKIIDVAVEGLSMGITQRDEFAAVIQKNNGDAKSLLAALRDRIGAK